jgi:hypothetical protein
MAYFALDYRTGTTELLTRLTALLVALAITPSELKALLLEAGGWGARGYRGPGVPLAAGGAAVALGWVVDLFNWLRGLQRSSWQVVPDPVDVLVGNLYSPSGWSIRQWHQLLLLHEESGVPTHDCASCTFQGKRLFTRTVGSGWASGLQE